MFWIGLSVGILIGGNIGFVLITLLKINKRQ